MKKFSPNMVHNLKLYLILNKGNTEMSKSNNLNTLNRITSEINKQVHKTETQTKSFCLN